MTKTVQISTETLNSLRDALGADIQGDVVKVPTEDTPMLGKVCVVRTYSAGVHIGEVVAKTGTNVLLKDAVRLWQWTEAFSLSEVATKGVGRKSRIADRVPYIELTQAAELIPASDEAIKTYEPRNG